MMQDLNNRDYAKLSDLKVGDKIQVDGDFTCLSVWSERIVQEDEEGLFISCNEGEHYLDGQVYNIHNESCYIGVYKL